MAIPLSQLPPDLIWNGQLDVSNPVKQTKYNQLNAAWEESTKVQDPVQKAEETTVQAWQRLNTERNKRFTEYNQNNPFAADEYMKNQAMAQANEQIGIESPISTYYKENLSDYLLGVDRKITRSTQDTNDLLTELTASTASYTGSLKNRLDESLNQARQGMADTGLFDSGQRYRQEGLLSTAAGEDLSNYQRKAGLKEKYYNTTQGRDLEDIALAKKMDVRNQYRESKNAVETLAGKLTTEAGQNYVRGFNATLPSELQANDNMDILKRIGIYQ